MDPMAWVGDMGIDPKELQFDHMTLPGQPEQHLSQSDSLEDVHPSLRYLSLGKPHANMMDLAGPNLGLQPKNLDMSDFTSPPILENHRRSSDAFELSNRNNFTRFEEPNAYQSTSHGGNQMAGSAVWPSQVVNSFADMDMGIFNELSKSISWQPTGQDSFASLPSASDDFVAAKTTSTKSKPVARRSQNLSSRSRKNRMRLSSRRSPSPAHNKHAQVKISHASSNTSSQANLTMASKVDPQEAIALFEASIQPFSTFSQLKAADLINQLKQLVLEEQKYGRGSQSSTSDVITTTTAPSTQDSISNPEQAEADCFTDNTSVSSTPRQLPKDDEDTDDSMSTGDSQADVKHEPCEHCGIKALLYCTWKNCGYSTHSFADYKRHESGEKHWPQERFMCLECINHSFPAGNISSSCTSCHVPFSALGTNIPNDYIQSRVQCRTARREITTFSRKDHLITHLRKDHNMLNMNKTIDTWKFGIDSNWPRQCGFCGIRFQTWTDRMNHLKTEFEKGNDISKWKLPFPKSMDFRPSGPTLPKDDDDDDHDDHFGGSGRPWTKSAGKRNIRPGPQSRDNPPRSNAPQRNSGQQRYRKADERSDSVEKSDVLPGTDERGKTSLTLQRYLNDAEESIAARLSCGRSEKLETVEREAVPAPELPETFNTQVSEHSYDFCCHIDKANRGKLKSDRVLAAAHVFEELGPEPLKPNWPERGHTRDSLEPTAVIPLQELDGQPCCYELPASETFATKLEHGIPNITTSGTSGCQTSDVEKPIHKGVNFRLDESADSDLSFDLIAPSLPRRLSSPRLKVANLHKRHSTTKHWEPNRTSSLFSSSTHTPSGKISPSRMNEVPDDNRVLSGKETAYEVPIINSSDSFTLQHNEILPTQPKYACVGHFVCHFGFAGCTSRFSSKNEWKRHVSTEHLAPNGLATQSTGSCGARSIKSGHDTHFLYPSYSDCESTSTLSSTTKYSPGPFSGIGSPLSSLGSPFTDWTSPRKSSPNWLFQDRSPELYNLEVDSLTPWNPHVDPEEGKKESSSLPQHPQDVTARFAQPLQSHISRNWNFPYKQETKHRLGTTEVEVLDKEFMKNHKPSTETKRQISEFIGGDLAHVNNWFQNRRARMKQQMKQEVVELGLDPENSVMKKPEKCPIQTREYHKEGFARKYDKDCHILTHYKGTMVCGFCPCSGSTAEKAFNRADVFKRHLVAIHGVDSTLPRSRNAYLTGTNRPLAEYVSGTNGLCSSCKSAFSNAQDFYDHLDDCILQVVQSKLPDSEMNMERERFKDRPQKSVMSDIAAEKKEETDLRSLWTTFKRCPEPPLYDWRKENAAPALMPLLNPTTGIVYPCPAPKRPNASQDAQLSNLSRHSPRSEFSSGEADLVFVHGLNGPSRKTWSSHRGTQNMSPRTSTSKSSLWKHLARRFADYYGMYQPLRAEKQEIRVLRINPASTHTDTVECTLDHVSLQNKPVFDALSYTWGDASVTERILVDGQHFEATKNLVAALREFRKAGLSEPIWIDAVCINQENVEEKLTQVRMMRDIYCAARKTLVWLGAPVSLPEVTRRTQWDTSSTSNFESDLDKNIRTIVGLESTTYSGKYVLYGRSKGSRTGLALPFSSSWKNRSSDGVCISTSQHKLALRNHTFPSLDDILRYLKIEEQKKLEQVPPVRLHTSPNCYGNVHFHSEDHLDAKWLRTMTDAAFHRYLENLKASSGSTALDPTKPLERILPVGGLGKSQCLVNALLDRAREWITEPWDTKVLGLTESQLLDNLLQVSPAALREYYETVGDKIAAKVSKVHIDREYRKAGDLLVICDAGGGTVDLSSYRLSRIEASKVLSSYRDSQWRRGARYAPSKSRDTIDNVKSKPHGSLPSWVPDFTVMGPLIDTGSAHSLISQQTVELLALDDVLTGIWEPATAFERSLDLIRTMLTQEPWEPSRQPFRVPHPPAQYSPGELLNSVSTTIMYLYQQHLSETEVRSCHHLDLKPENILIGGRLGIDLFLMSLFAGCDKRQASTEANWLRQLESGSGNHHIR
ncbi:hypothetical protein ONS96_006852 [Cadophora gregata f. sp. sojae]|nr:hypothetical protein ONS96_006852 [Cadophora gregata f. sp. sojae]